MKTSYYLVPAACIVAAAVTIHTQSSGRSGARELPAIPAATVPLTAEAPPPFGVENVQLPPVVSPPSHFVVPVAAPLAIPAASTAPVEATPLPTIPTVPTPAAPAPLPAIPATPAMLPAMPAVTPAVSITLVPTVPPVAPVNPPKPAPPVAAPVVPVIPAPAAPAVPVVPVAPALPVVPVTPPAVTVPAPAPTALTVAPAVPIIPATPEVPVLVPPEGVQPKPTPAPQPQPPMLLPAPTPLPVPTQPVPATTGDEAAVVTPSKFILTKPNKLFEGSVTVTGEKAVLRQGSLERAIPKTDVLYVADTKDEIYKFVLAQVSPTDPTARIGVARWLMFAGLREQALTEAREIMKLQPGNTVAAGLARSLEESLKHFPPEGTPVVAAKPAAGTLVSTERDADVTPEGSATFASRAQPVLANQCMDCHARADYPGAFKLIRITGFEVGPQSTKANLRATAAQFKKEDPLSAPLLAKALTQHGGMKQPAFVSRLAPGYRTLEAWVSLATPPVTPPVSPMTAPTQPTLPPQVVVQPMPVPMNPVLPAVEEVPPIPQAEPLLTKPAVPPPAPPAMTTPLLPPVPTPSIPAPSVEPVPVVLPTPTPLEPIPTLPLPSVDPQPIPAPAVPLPVAPLPSIPASSVPDVALPALPMIPAGTPTLPAPPVETLPSGPPPILPTPPSLPQIESQVKPPELPTAPPSPSAPKQPVKLKPATTPTPSLFGTAIPPKPPATGPAGGDEFDPANFNPPK